MDNFKGLEWRRNKSRLGSNGLHTEYHEGMKRFSVIDMHYLDLAYYSEHSHDAGLWGYVDEAGNVVVEPQYIIAKDFYGGIARVCRGEWTNDEKWNNEYVTGGYWSEEMLWGAIDKTGKEVIPCKFDEIEEFFNTNDYYYAHHGGWENGKWGIIDRQGNWILSPKFERIGPEFSEEGLFVYYDEDPNATFPDPRMGIYDMKFDEIVFRPQFLDVSFLADGWIEVETYDESIGAFSRRVIDRYGKEREGVR